MFVSSVQSLTMTASSCLVQLAAQPRMQSITAGAVNALALIRRGNLSASTSKGIFIHVR